jgi:hypothetical protein
MDLFESARLAHIGVGTIVLIAFWGAACVRKGSTPHRRFGRLYVIAMAVLLAATLMLAAGSVAAGAPMRAVFNVYVTLISVASVWMAWSSIAYRDDIERYRGWPYRLICLALGGYGLFLLAMVPKMGEPARMAMVAAFATLGLAIAGAMAWRLVRGAEHVRWWLSEHLTAMAINFAATHASFSILAMSAIFPALKEPWTRTAILTAWMLSALVVRLAAGRRFLRQAPQASSPANASGAIAASASPAPSACRRMNSAGPSAAVASARARCAADSSLASRVSSRAA